MGLLDQVGQVLGGIGAQGQGSAGGGNQLLQLLVAYIQNQPGGLAGLLGRFQQAGLGDLAATWVGSGPNQAVASDQLEAALGSEAIEGIAAALGGGRENALTGLSALLPNLVDQLTPKGKVDDDLDLNDALGALSKRFLG